MEPARLYYCTLGGAAGNGEKWIAGAGCANRGMRSLRYTVNFVYTIYLIQEEENEESCVFVGGSGCV